MLSLPIVAPSTGNASGKGKPHEPKAAFGHFFLHSPGRTAPELYKNIQLGTAEISGGPPRRRRGGGNNGAPPGRLLPVPGGAFEGNGRAFGRGRRQNSRLPNATHRPLLRSKSMMFSPEMSTWTRVPMVKRVLPNTTPVSRKSPMRTLMVDSMPVGMAP